MKAAFLAVLIVAGVLAVACGGSDTATLTTVPTRAATVEGREAATIEQPTQTPRPSPTVTATEKSEPTAAMDTGPAVAGIIDFDHESLTVKVGSAVEWKHRGRFPHTTTSGTGPEDSDAGVLWDSGTLQGGQTFSHTYTEAGRFPYFCRIHPTQMFGVITVEDAPLSQPPAPEATVIVPVATLSPTQAQPTSMPESTPAAPSTKVIVQPTTAAAAATATPTPTAEPQVAATQEPTPVPTPEPTPAPTPTPMPTATTAPEPTATPVPAVTHQVDITERLAFSPLTVNVDVGDTVKWTVTGIGHTTTSGEPGKLSGVWRSPPPFLKIGESFSFTFKEEGSFSYFCELHPTFPNMRAVVNVGEAARGTAVPPTPVTAAPPARATTSAPGGSTDPGY